MSDKMCRDKLDGVIMSRLLELKNLSMDTIKDIKRSELDGSNAKLRMFKMTLQDLIDDISDEDGTNVNHVKPSPEFCDFALIKKL